LPDPVVRLGLHAFTQSWVEITGQSLIVIGTVIIGGQ